MLLSLLLQVAALAALIAAPLIYTQVLPRAQLRSVFAAPAPPHALPKPPATVRTAPTSTRSFRFTTLDMRIRPLPKVPEGQIAPPSASFDPGIAADIDSTAVTLPGTPVRPPDPPPVVMKPANKPLRIARMQASQLLHKVQPAYPPMAKLSRVQGIVEFTATIGKTGSIENLQLIRGNPLLVKAAEDAIVQWKYQPTLLNGEPVEVITDIVVNFTLTQ
jgi:protein TonB